MYPSAGEYIELPSVVQIQYTLCTMDIKGVLDLYNNEGCFAPIRFSIAHLV